jgi:hypothetical protein
VEVKKTHSNRLPTCLPTFVGPTNFLFLNLFLLGPTNLGTYLLVLAHLRRQWSLSGRERFGVLSPSRRDSGVFVEMKRLFSFTSNDEKGGEVVEVFLAEKQASDAGFGGVRRGHRVCCLTRAALCQCVSTRRAGGRATNAWRQRLVKVASAGFEGGVARSVGQTLSASGEGALDASAAAPRGFEPFWTAFDGRTPRLLVGNRPLEI